MDILQNPFYVLSASPRDNRRRIVELADERSLLFDSNKCVAARSDLTNPRKRLSAEIAWLPGIGPRRAQELLYLLESAPEDLHAAIRELPEMARANLLAAGLARLLNPTSENLQNWIVSLAWTFEDIKIEELVLVLNEDRIASGFPEITDISAVETGIKDLRKYYRDVIYSALDNLPSRELVRVITELVETETNVGNSIGSILIHDLIDAFDVAAQPFFEQEERNINTLVERLRTFADARHPDSVLAHTVNLLILVVKNWDTVAQPIQVSFKSRGLAHERSQNIAALVRGLVLYLYNTHDKLEFSQQITKMLQEVFAEVGNVAEQTAVDADTLYNIAKNTKEWRKEITYEFVFEGFFKNRTFRLSPEGIEWDEKRWELGSIRKIRWGGVANSSMGATYSISFGDEFNFATVYFENMPAIYTNFVTRLWEAVCVRLLAEHLVGLRAGEAYFFGAAVVIDVGVQLERKKLFGQNEQIFCRWDELEIWNEPGVFCMGKKGDKRWAVSLSYLREDNVHILEAAMRAFWKQKGNRLSSLLEG